MDRDGRIGAVLITERGDFYANYQVWIERVPKLDPRDTETFGIRIAEEAPMGFEDRGGFAMDREQAQALYDQLSKALGKRVEVP